MESDPGQPLTSKRPPAADSIRNAEAASENFSMLAALLGELTEAEPGGVIQQDSQRTAENRLASRRLGTYGGLFAALRAKHTGTASHSLRVAIGCSTWAESINLPDESRELLEVAALLHDIGKIGVSDVLLCKPSELKPDEMLQVDNYRRHTLEILVGCQANRQLLDAVFYASAWYDGSRPGFDLAGDEIPSTARMLAIVDAFDSMTTDHVYRKAMATERAVAELFTYSGTQFDPRLVKSFCQLIESNPKPMSGKTGSHWLTQLNEGTEDQLWGGGKLLRKQQPTVDQLFQSCLIDQMRDAVIFVDPQCRIMVWNRSAEKFTGIAQASIYEKQWLPSLLNLRDEEGEVIQDHCCPVANAIKNGERDWLRVHIDGRSNRSLAMDLQICPVAGKDSVVYGASIILHDASSEVSLAERLEVLNARVHVDPLTKVANRAEIDRVHEEMISTHVEQRVPFSLVLCDIDFFKRINDDYGHQAGDEALMMFASMLKRFKRAGDLVGRYGGEEFVLLMVDCDVTGAASRAEEIRQTLESTPLSMLDYKCLTASFGVTEVQPGDTPDTMIRRADRALLQAKETGRNKVMHVGGGGSADGRMGRDDKRKRFNWLKAKRGEDHSSICMVTSVPIDVAVEKLRGFVSDQHAQVIKVEGKKVQIRVDGKTLGMNRRTSDRPVPFLVDVEMSDLKENQEFSFDNFRHGTLIQIYIEPIRNRDRRRKDLVAQIENLFASMKAYFMAVDLRELNAPNVERAATEPGRRE